jgi:hypothetical protein
VTELCEIGARYRTDKVVAGYTAFYHALLSPHRDRIRRVLEIGIGSVEAMRHVENYIVGASLFMWRDYFPQAQIYGLDVDARVAVHADRITSICGDQRSEHDLYRVARYGCFDLIVDDGEHAAAAQMAAFEALIHSVEPGGFYIIEDAEEHVLISDWLTALAIPHSVVFCRAGMSVPGKLVLVPR